MKYLISALGLCVGSFLNVLIYRLPRGMSFARGRSFCPRCRKKISWHDNVPLISYLFLKGKCRGCGKKIPLRYPLVELITAIFFLQTWQLVLKEESFSSLPTLITKAFFFWVIAAALLVIFFTDIEQMIIPDEMVFLLSLAGGIFNFFINPRHFFQNYLLVAVLAALFFWFLHRLTKGKGMGLGDVKLAFSFGMVFGYPGTLFAIYLAFLTGAFFSVILILLGKLNFGQKIAFGPFLVIGGILALFCQEKFRWIIQSFF